MFSRSKTQSLSVHLRVRLIKQLGEEDKGDAYT